jgi:hypothetical protein
VSKSAEAEPRLRRDGEPMPNRDIGTPAASVYLVAIPRQPAVYYYPHFVQSNLLKCTHNT